MQRDIVGSEKYLLMGLNHESIGDNQILRFSNSNPPKIDTRPIRNNKIDKDGNV